jgi:hypothetical protein
MGEVFLELDMENTNEVRNQEAFRKPNQQMMP